LSISTFERTNSAMKGSQKIIVFATSVVSLIVLVLTVAVAEEKSVDEYDVLNEVDLCMKKVPGLSINGRINPFYLSGDFNGDGELDFEVQVLRSGSKGIVICLSNSSAPLLPGAGSSMVFPIKGKWRFDAWSVVPKENKSLTRPAKARYDAILLDVKKTANGLLYWDGGRMQWSQLGD